MSTGTGRSPLYQSKYKINDYFSIRIPLLREILEDESAYYETVSVIVSTPYDMMVSLDNIGIDFSTISDWDLFCILFKELQTRDMSLIFDDIALNDFTAAVNKQNNDIVFINKQTGAMIDRGIHEQICRALRRIHFLKRNYKTPGNEEARRFMIQRARVRLERSRKSADKHSLEKQIVSLVNTAEFPYDYDSVLDMSIYQFNASLHQIIKKIKFDNLMIGCYAGTVNINELSQDELSWFSN